MTIESLLAVLDENPTAIVAIRLPDGGLVPPHAHVTEVGRITRTFLDCGGTLRETVFCCLQLWVAEDTDHRLAAGKLAGIIRRGLAALSLAGLEIQMEYEDGVVAQFPLDAAVFEEGALILQLGDKHTDCLAKDVCLPDSSGGSDACCAGSSCC